MYFHLIDIISILFEAFIIFSFYKSLGNKKINIWLLLSTYVSFILISSIITVFIDSSIIRMIVLFIYIFILSLLYEFNNKIRWFSILLLFIIINISEIIIGLLMTIIFSKTVNEIQNTLLYYTVGVLCSKSLAYLIIKFIQLKNKATSIKVSKSIILLYSILPIITLMIGIMLIGGLGTNITSRYSTYGVIAEILLVIANISVFYIFENYVNKANLEHKLELETEQHNIETKYLEEKIEKQILSAKEMHDLKNQLFAIKDLMHSDQNDGINKINEICEIVEGMQNIVYTTNTSLDSLINSKKTKINLYNIEFLCDCFIASFNNIDNIDLCIIVGNLLDNAVEASLKIETNRKIILNFRQVNNFLNIIIKNRYNKEDNQNLETTKNNKLNHGFGLNNIKSIIKKYDGNLQIIKDEDYFITSVLIKN